MGLDILKYAKLAKFIIKWFPTVAATIAAIKADAEKEKLQLPTVTITAPKE